MNPKSRLTASECGHSFSGEIRSLFSEEGFISRLFPSYELRPEQIEYSTEVAGLLEQEGVLVIEAGTGVGKSIGYLIPAVAWAIKNNGRVTISTHTKNLQNQLTGSDIPLVAKILKTPFSYFSLKGKANYVCLKRLAEARDTSLPLDGRDDDFFPAVGDWVEKSDGKDAADLSYPGAGSSPLWPAVSAEGLVCDDEECELSDRCFLKKARRKARQATVLVVNHSLLVTDFVLGGGYLPERNILIIDEAHNVEKVLTEELSVSIGRSELRKCLVRSVGKGGKGGALRRIRKRLSRGKGGKTRNVIVDGVSESLFTFWESVDTLLQEIEINASSALSAERKVRYDERLFSSGQMKEIGRASEMFGEVSRHFQDVEALLGNEPAGGAPSTALLEVRALRNEWNGVHESFGFLTDPFSQEHVYWADAQEGSLRLSASPLDVSEKARKLLCEKTPSVLLTSATITVGKSFDYFNSKVGLSALEPERNVLLGSPFDFKKNVFFGASPDFPVPGEEDWAEESAKDLGALFSRVRRNALLLFTSHDSLRRCYSVLKESLRRESIRVIGQGIDGSASEITHLFGERRPAVLLGTSSLWEGVDFPGEELELLVIARLPFPVPKDPLVEARSEILSLSGVDPFLNYSLPEAVIRFRQGFGRLVRRKGDRGACVVLDPRIATKQYGKVFAFSVPSDLKVFGKREELLKNVEEWFS